MSLEVKFARKFFFFDDLLRSVVAQHNCARVIRCKRTCYTGRFLAQQNKGSEKGAQKASRRKLTTRMLHETRSSWLVVASFRASSKTCNAKIVQKIVSAFGNKFWRSIVALKIIVANRRVYHHLRQIKSLTELFIHRKSKKDAGKKLATFAINSDEDNSEKENVCNDSDDVFAWISC